MRLFEDSYHSLCSFYFFSIHVPFKTCIKLYFKIAKQFNSTVKSTCAITNNVLPLLLIFGANTFYCCTPKALTLLPGLERRLYSTQDIVWLSTSC